jgi:hypothetical protein
MITSVQVLVEVNNWAALVPVGQVYHTRFDEWPYEDVLSLPLLFVNCYIFWNFPCVCIRYDFLSLYWTPTFFV